MREIRFRMFDTIEREFMNGSRVIESRIYELHNKGRFIFQQYTGLKDKFGQEIYEGDVVKFKHSCEREYDAVGVVEYKQQWCGFYFADNRRLNSNMNLRVIGNIYEDPQLLEVAE
jgi:uncharacterized phage protein (TIGR01671 family)